MSEHYQPTLRNRLLARRNPAPQPEPPLAIPASGLLPADVVAVIQDLARHAKAGDTCARDRLFTSLQPRLHRKGLLLRPWPNTPDCTGIWDRDDVAQESWIVFVDLLAGWDGETLFVPYLLSRFAWRLRDHILRGIGKPLPRMGSVRVPEDLLGELLAAHDSDQPESALLASKLLEHLLETAMSGEVASVDPRTVMALLRSSRLQALQSQSILPDDDHPFSQIEAA